MSSPTDDWRHFDPDERIETILHLRARQELVAWEDSGGQDD